MGSRISVRVTDTLKREVKECIIGSEYKNESDLVRSLLRFFVSSRRTDKKVRL